jgi:hypothetical protein
MSAIFTLAPKGHPTNPAILEAGYKLWSTYRQGDTTCTNRFYVRSNLAETAGGQNWHLIAEATIDGTWYVDRGLGFLAQGGMLLARFLIDRGMRVRSQVVAYQGKVCHYPATAKVYSLPSILNGMVAVVSRDNEADRRQAARKVSLADMIAARVERAKKGGAK